MTWESSLHTKDKIPGAHRRVSSGVMDTMYNDNNVKNILLTLEKILVSFSFNTQGKANYKKTKTK